MSQAASPIRAVVDVQRTAIRQGEQAIKQGLAAQRSANRPALAGLEGQESLQRQGLEPAQAATDADVGSSTPVVEGRGRPRRARAVDETLAGPVHGAVVADEAGTKCLLYHAYDRTNPWKGPVPRRVLLLDRLRGKDGLLTP